MDSYSYNDISRYKLLESLNIKRVVESDITIFQYTLTLFKSDVSVLTYPWLVVVLPHNVRLTLFLYLCVHISHIDHMPTFSLLEINF